MPVSQLEFPDMPTGASPITVTKISGMLREKDVKRLVSKTRSANIGPTALYYAGVTAPVISSGVALTVRTMIDSSGMTTYWIWLISSFIAAMSGICWYLIFMRWSYRHHDGRASEVDTETAIDLMPEGIHIRRGEVETRIGWRAVESVKQTRRDTLITFYGAGPLLIPNRWFGKDKAAAQAFREQLQEGLTHGTQLKRRP
ncbi:YcxB family protein [Henriciella sp. AS95]|uniref:YcxB family protein n=1 Tax=Henriciella sp. AS95 TaxID=3135782 RepID=UPI00317EE76F